MDTIDKSKNKNLFHLRWMFMTPRERYAHIWSKTKHLEAIEYHPGKRVNMRN